MESDVPGIRTSHGLGGFLALMLLLLVVFHFAGFRVIFTVGGAAGRAV